MWAVEIDLIFSLALFPAIDGALLRHPLNRTPKAAQRELHKDRVVDINVHYLLSSPQRNSKLQCLSCARLIFGNNKTDISFLALSAALL